MNYFRWITAGVVGVGLLALAVLTPMAMQGNVEHGPVKRSPVNGKRKAQKVVSVAGSFATDADKPETMTYFSSLIVQGKVIRKEPARSVVGHQVEGASRINRGNYAWHDYLVDVEKVLYRGEEAPRPGKQIWVRSYNAETPEVKFGLMREPKDIPIGKRLVLFLTELDTLAYSVSPEHWRLASGYDGIFEVTGNRVKRTDPFTIPEKTTIMPLSELEAIIREATKEEKKAGYLKWKREINLPKGVH